MGVAGISKIIISSNTISRAVTIQPGNYNQVITIKYINAFSQYLLPFIILLGKLYQASQYRNIPPNQVLIVSDNRQITNQLGLSQLKHFNRYTAPCIARVYYLLIVNGYSSYATPKFNQYYIQNRIISLYIPAYLSYLLQLLNVSYYFSLKRVYRQEIAKLARL